MSFSRSVTTVLTLGVLTILAVTFCAKKAQAEWQILTSGGIVKTGKELNAMLNGELESGVKEILLSEILKIKVEKTCSAVELINVKLVGESKISGGRLKFTGCTISLNGKLNAACTPHVKGAPPGTLETMELKGEAAAGLIKIEPSGGTQFLTMELSESCPIGEKVSINGVLYAKDCENQLATHLVKHLVEEGSGTDMWLISNTAEHKVHLDGSAWGFLGGAHTGLKWGVS